MFDANKIFTVSEFNTFLKDVLNELGIFSISGEITELSVTAKKGVYLTISDGSSNLRLSGYYPIIKGMDLVEKGMKVIVKGYSDIYVPYGSFSVCINSIEPDGEGSLAIAYEKLKKVLAEKGYFSEERKKPLPEFITRIALLTGKDSAAYSDFIKILKEHKAGIEVDFYPVIVQGENSVKSVLSAFSKAEFRDYDLIILTRGGGSLEDLKSFNDIEIADLIFKSRIPVIVGVGHEKDESIADFVADLRASTPSQAAYYILERNVEFLNKLKEKGENIYDQLFKYIENQILKLEDYDYKILSIINNKINEIKNKLEFSKRILKSYDLKEILARGFCIIVKNEKQVKSSRELSLGDKLSLKLHDGGVSVRVE
ncbi:exodeoxyribonuclease VII large subunit [Candidatus Dojkabacteria bacterium]|nr:exodeoxyribonuclease VII large subunit [Candidatus Dojkabacteria bacterium]